MSGDQAKPRTSAASPPGTAAIPTRAGESEATPATSGTEAASSSEPQNKPEWTSWRTLWQVPSVVISVVLIVTGIVASIHPAAANDFDGALNQVEKLIAAGALEQAGNRMRSAVEPNLQLATGPQKARFHASAADLLFAAQQAQGMNDDAVNRKICVEYAQAEESGATLTPKRLEQWAQTLLSLGDLEAVRAKLTQLDELKQKSAATDNGGDLKSANELHNARNHVFRELVQFSMRQPHLSFDSLMEMVTGFRLDEGLSAADQHWAIARQAELRLEAGFPQQAVDFLLIDMRRLESDAAPNPPVECGELYMLLGRGYFELGDDIRAQSHLERALTQLAEFDPVRGDALVLMGQVALARGEHQSAYEKFHLVVRDFINTRSYLPGMLGRAEVQSMLGDHPASLEDYRTLVMLLSKVGMRRDISPARVAQNLCERHDASVALGHLDRALEYVSIAEGLFPPEQAPPEVLARLASTNRQVADDLLATGVAESELGSTHPPRKIDPAVRFEANARYERSGAYALRHANAVTSSSDKDEWAASMWMAADCYDRGGRQDLAIQQFRRYLDARPVDDPRRADTLWRLAQAHHSLTEFDKAIPYYEQVIGDRARSTLAAQSYVPLAKCYVATNRRSEAVQLLRQVLSGDRLLKPDAQDYRNALVELGRIYYDTGDFTAAIEQFAQAVQRYPNDSGRAEILFLLADSYRGNAMAIAEKIKQETALPPAEVGRLNSLRTEQLQNAQDFFDAVCQMTSSTTPETMIQPDEDLLRRAHLYRADCAFYLGQYQQAVDMYDQAARKYSAHQSSMYALIQIVNCYSALNDAERSAAAHHRALVRLKQLPDSAFEAPDALMDRAAWERWLENTPVATERTAAAVPSG